jgi:hypothetical protein
MTDAVASLTYQNLAELLEREGYPPESYGIGRRGKYRDQAFVADKWSKPLGRVLLRARRAVRHPQACG